MPSGNSAGAFAFSSSSLRPVDADLLLEELEPVKVQCPQLVTVALTTHKVCQTCKKNLFSLSFSFFLTGSTLSLLISLVFLVLSPSSASAPPWMVKVLACTEELTTAAKHKPCKSNLVAQSPTWWTLILLFLFFTRAWCRIPPITPRNCLLRWCCKVCNNAKHVPNDTYILPIKPPPRWLPAIPATFIGPIWDASPTPMAWLWERMPKVWRQCGSARPRHSLRFPLHHLPWWCLSLKPFWHPAAMCGCNKCGNSRNTQKNNQTKTKLNHGL